MPPKRKTPKKKAAAAEINPYAVTTATVLEQAPVQEEAMEQDVAPSDEAKPALKKG